MRAIMTVPSALVGCFLMLLSLQWMAGAEDVAHLSFTGVRCPKMCTCIGTAVDCSRRGLTTVPRNIPLETERL